MSMPVRDPEKQYQYIIETDFRAYPREYYFARRYRDLLPRFKRVIGAFPKRFQVEKMIQVIEEINDKFAKKMVTDLSEPPKTSLFLCYSKTERLDQAGLQQTITEKYELKTQTPAVPKELKNAILELKDIYATGTVYDVLEIHAKEETEVLKEDVSALMRKYGYTQPYRIKTVKKDPVKMMADIQHENGKLIKSPYPGSKAKYQEGTLGCFVENDRKKLYILTCAHVVENPDKEEHDVLIQDRAQRLKKIGKSTRNLTVCSGTGEMPVIDIAAVTINEDLERQCIRKMKNDDGLNRIAVVVMETVDQLPEKLTYKQGAKSKLTPGFICSFASGDYTSSGTGEDDYLLLVESLPGSGNGSFAEKCDFTLFGTREMPGIDIVVVMVNEYFKKQRKMKDESGLNITADVKDKKLLSFIPSSGSVIQKFSCSRYQHVYLTNKGAHAYNGNGPGDRNGQPSRSTSHAVSTAEPLRTCLENRKRIDELTTSEVSDDLRRNQRKRDLSTETVTETKRMKAETCTQNTTMKATESTCELIHSNAVPTDIQCNIMAQNIGSEYLSLGCFLHLTRAEMDHLHDDYRRVVPRIFAMLSMWKEKCCDEASFKELAKAMKMARINPHLVFNKL